MTVIALDELNAAAKDDFVGALGDIFEHAPWIAEAASDARPFATLEALFDAMRSAVQAADAQTQTVLIKGHPDLAGKAARAGTLTVDSTAEQASVGLDRLPEDDYARFHRLNDAYRSRFGIPFIVCVRRHTRDSILRQFERRLLNDVDTERETALTEIFRIAALRLDQRVAAPDRLQVHGRLSTHVLDIHAGRPAAGVGVDLWLVPASGAPVRLVRASTNADGRTDEPLIAGRPIPVGTYELRFAMGDYFANRAERVQLADPAFLDIIPIRFSVAEPEGHYHVPLSCTPWAYSTYRGS